MSSNSKDARRQSNLSNDKQVEVGSKEKRGTEEDHEGEYEKEESVSVTNHLFIKPIENTRNLDKEVILRRIRHRKRMNKVRAAVGAILGTNNGHDTSVQQKRWVDDAFAAL